VKGKGWHRSRVCQFVIDVSDLDQGVAFWTAAIDGVEEETSETSREIYRRISPARLGNQNPASEDRRQQESKERMHIDLETDNVGAEVERLEALGAVRWITSKNAGLTSGRFWTHGVMNSTYYKKSSRNSWQTAAPGLPCPWGLTGQASNR
jgi:hypothetical protein